MHRRPEYYGPDADDFRPERWETLRPGWEYLPFNGGPRICIGQGFALMEAAYTTVRVAQEFVGVEGRDGVSGLRDCWLWFWESGRLMAVLGTMAGESHPHVYGPQRREGVVDTVLEQEKLVSRAVALEIIAFGT